MAQVFDELLLDADPALNYGNWMWLSCSCFFYQYVLPGLTHNCTPDDLPSSHCTACVCMRVRALRVCGTLYVHRYFRCYSPVAFPQKYDKDGAYVRKWLPQLRNFPSKYIYEPWKAPLAEQRKAGCVVGADYPMPIVDHQAASKANMEKMAAAYAAHKAAAAVGTSAAKASQKRPRGD